MDKKKFTLLFLFVSTIANIVFTVAIITVLLVGTSLLLRYVIQVHDANVIVADWMFCFIAGMILSLFLYAKISDKIVKKYKLADKLDERLSGRRFSHLSSQAQKQKEEKPKSVMPKSVLPDEEEDERWQE